MYIDVYLIFAGAVDFNFTMPQKKEKQIKKVSLTSF